MKYLLIALLVSISFTSNGSTLWNNNDIYFLGEYLHDARYDYEGSISLKFKEERSSNTNYFVENKSQVCSIVSSEEILEVIENSINAYLDIFPEEDFDFYRAFNVLSNKLGSYASLSICNGSHGEKRVLSGPNDFVLSFKIINF